MDSFCGSKFWDLNLTWYTDDPRFTECFERTALIWIPCLFLWTFTSLEVFYIINSKYRDIPWSLLNVSKLFITCLLIILTVIDLVKNLTSRSEVYGADIFSPLVKILTFIFSAVLLYYNKKHGFQTSGLLFLFWLLLLFCGVPQLKSEIQNVEREEEPYYSSVSYLIYYSLVVIIFLLNCFADKPPRKCSFLKSPKPCPEPSCSFLSRISFNWFNSIMWKGFRKPLLTSDLWDLNYEDMSKEVVPIFNKYWDKEVQKHERFPRENVNASFSGKSGHVDIESTPKKREASILPVIIKAFGSTFLFSAFLELINIILNFVNPQVLNLLISFVQHNQEQWKGYLYVFLLFGCGVLRTFVVAQCFTRIFLFGMRVRSSLTSAIYRKSLCISNATKREKRVGEIVNLMAVDAQMFMEIGFFLNVVWSAPLQIVLALYFLWQILGPSVLAGVGMMIILVPINSYVVNKTKNLHKKQMKNKDERVKLMNEVLNGMKVLKLYAWEKSFEEQIFKVRQKEIKVLKQASFLNVGSSFIWSCTPFMVCVLTFTTYLLIDENNVLDAQKAFVSLSLFNILRMPLNFLPMTITSLAQLAVSIKRINNFLNAEELDPQTVHHNPSEKHPLLIENGNFDWNEGPILKDINLHVEKGELVAVVGSVGSGKSSLVFAFLGEMNKTSGYVNTVGSIAYVPQQAWIQNATLRDNVLFGKPFNKNTYDRVIEACALKPDFDMLPAGDQTEIGEKGINLSGGQRQRISLARAVYANADVYLLDDPLSAVDSHVGKHIFENIIGPSGLLKNKTRVLVTHGITYLPDVNRIVVLKEGQISELGTYNELLESKGAFADFLTQYITEVAEEENNEELILLQKQLSHSSISEEITKTISRCKSLSESEQSDSLPQKQNSLNSLQHQQSVNSLRQRSVDGSTEQNLYKRSISTVSKRSAKHDEIVGKKLIQEEKAETGTVKFVVYKYYLKAVGIFFSAGIILFQISSYGFSVGSNVWLSVWSEDPELQINGTVNTAKRDMYLGVYGSLGVFQGISVLLASLSRTIGCVQASVLIHSILVTAVMRWPLGTFDVTPLGRILNRFSSDIQTIDLRLPQEFDMFVMTFIRAIGTVFVVCFATPIFFAVVVPMAVVYYFVQKFYVATSRQLKRLESVSRSPIYSHFSETITGAATIRAYDVQTRFIRESEARVDFNQVCLYPGAIAGRWLAVRLEMVGNLLILFAALFAVLGQNQNAGLVGLSISYILQITGNLNMLVRSTTMVETNIVSVERVKEYEEAPQEPAWEIPNKAPPRNWPEYGAVTFNNYSTRYRPGLELVLKNITLDINGGEKVGIVGRTGAGKSSLTLALFRIIEAAEGEILIDGINIADIGLHDLRSQLTIIPQEAVLFSGSLRMNLDPFDKHDDEEIWQALEHAHLKGFVESLPAGLNHNVSEGGENLSVGQKQLICLARALLRKTKVLILDEATAAVDLETDDLIQRTIRTEFKDCTVLTIAHRLNTVMDYERIVVLDKGRLVEFDSPNNLLSNKQSIFYEMAKDAGLV